MAKLLYVEDNEDNIYMLSTRLRREGFEVAIARNGKEGVALALSDQPDLIIMDLVLPKLGGFDAIRLIKSSSETSSIPIIALSASVLPEHQHRAIDAGCDEFEVKPVDFPKLLEKIKFFLEAPS